MLFPLSAHIIKLIQNINDTNYHKSEIDFTTQQYVEVGRKLLFIIILLLIFYYKKFNNVLTIFLFPVLKNVLIFLLMYRFLFCLYNV